MRLERNPFSLSVSAMGGYVTRWQWSDRHLFFPEQVVSVQGKNKLRGGNPIMAPYFSKPSGKFEGLPQHGWLRGEGVRLDRPVPDVIGTSFTLPEDENKYPWELEGLITHQLENFSLETKLELWPDNDQPSHFSAPVNPGFHPYFNNPAGCEITIGREKIKVNGQGEFRRRLLMVMPIKIEINTIGTVSIEPGGDFDGQSVILIWTDKQERYVCVEPVLRPPEDFNKGEALCVNQDRLIEISCVFSFSDPHCPKK